MACVYIPDRLLGLVKILVITFFFSCVMSLVVLVLSRELIIDNWDEYKCNPMITPFASAFGHDSAATMQQCSSEVFHSQAAPMIGSLTGVFGDIADLGDELMTGLSHSVEGLDANNKFTTSVFGNFMAQLDNVGSTFQGLVIQFQTLFARLAASLLTIVYTLESVFYALTGVRPAVGKMVGFATM
jgi:hypothetical protein